MRVETRIDSNEINEASSEETRADQQYDSQRDLQSSPGCSGSGVVPWPGVDRDALCLSASSSFTREARYRRRESEQDAGHRGNDQRKKQHRRVQADALQVWNLRRVQVPEGALRPANPTRSATAPAAIASTKLSVSNCVAMRSLGAPSAARTASSFCRAAPTGKLQAGDIHT